MSHELLERAEARDRVIQAIKEGKPIGVESYSNHGDAMVAAWPWIIATWRLCEEEDIDKQTIQFAQDNSEYCHTNGISLPCILDSVSPGMVRYYYGISHASNQAQVLRRLGSKLGITTIIQRDYIRVPEPVRVAGTVFETFDLVLMHQQAKDLKEDHFKDARVVAIAQFGGNNAKRFSNEDTERIAGLIKKKFPDILILRITDGHFSRKESYGIVSHKNKGVIDMTITPKDITQVCAAFHDVSYLITTDGFGSHLGFGCMAMSPEKDGVLRSSDGISLFTVADSLAFAVSGIQSVISPTMADVLHNNNPIFQHFITEAKYMELNNLKVSRISPRDMDAFMEELSKISLS